MASVTGRGGSWPAFAAALIAVLITFGPDFAVLGTHVLGADGADVPKHVWGQWWVHRSLVNDGVIPLRLDLDRYPDGGRFFCLDTGNGILTVPLRWFLGPVGAYNLLLMLHLGLASVAAWALGREVSGSRAAALVTGVAFAFSPMVLTHAATTGIAETAFLAPLPLLVLAILLSLQHRHWAWALAAGALSLIQAVGCWTYCVHAGVFIVGLGVTFLLSDGRPRHLFRGARTGPWLAGRVALYAAVLAVAVLPLYLAIQGTVTGADIAYSRGASLLPGTQGIDPLRLPPAGTFPVADFFLPGAAGTRVDIHSLETLISSGYLGYSLIAMALLGAVVAPAARPFAALALLFASFSLGPTLYLEHDLTGPRWINVVFLAFYKLFPLFHETRNSMDRFLVSAHLCMGVSAAAGLAWGMDRLGRRWRWPLGIGAAGLVLAEVLLVSSTVWPIPAFRAAPTEVSLALAEGEGAVLELPFFREEGGFEGNIFLQQVYHGRPIPFGLDGMGQQVVAPTVQANPFYKQLSGPLFEETYAATPRGCLGVDSLARADFRAVVLRSDRLPPERAAAVQGILDTCLGAPRSLGPARLYTIKAP